MSANEPVEIVQKMLEKDAFSQWLDIKVRRVKAGFSELEMTIRADMLNGFGVAHGGISFALADSALAFASNAVGQKSVSIDTSIQHLKPVKLGDILIATAEQENDARTLGHYSVRITRQGELVALFKGMVFKKNDTW